MKVHFDDAPCVEIELVDTVQLSEDEQKLISDNLLELL